MTQQGAAICEVSIKFGDRETLPFAPCKKGYHPLVNGVKMYACRLHHSKRKKRVVKEFHTYRLGETPLDSFWPCTVADKDETKSPLDTVRESNEVCTTKETIGNKENITKPIVSKGKRKGVKKENLKTKRGRKRKPDRSNTT